MTSATPQPGQLIVITGPSGVGKGTLLRQLRQRHPELALSVSATTRPPRPTEVAGVDYYFVSVEEFKAMIAAGQLLEWAEFAGHYYGTPRQPLVQLIAQGKTVILEIELQGARQVRQSYPQARHIFILPPSLAELEHRLRSRGQDSEEAIARRLAQAETEIAAAPEFDVQIVNDDLEKSLIALETAIFSPAP
ncbi:guanylate kinase [Thermosynechococcus vestitus]|uniref:Guanylate kinase n=1 Tax=Thermosynechococcus vestitus (strain NIES-2133 / IAM M-273 / BP-1) TaxID=197221 RepID=KGUA_THEVB|nr:guanylate kinase [Thermosynechococcus vestitus]Q8DMQ7.1 RecName: Full=Guanylate kinase; AltName: Full=GMP kinase [Thermosynechococcus vestitus BP-1]BAC07607.1 guanylate kinase [Thermosynechococcus vestitus BP-1]